MHIPLFLPSVIYGLRMFDTHAQSGGTQAQCEGMLVNNWVNYARYQIFWDGRASLALASDSISDSLAEIFVELDAGIGGLTSAPVHENRADSRMMGVASVAAKLLVEMRFATIHLGNVVDGLIELASPRLQAEWGTKYYLSFAETVSTLADDGRIELALEAGVLHEPLSRLVRRLMSSINAVPGSLSENEIVSHPAMADVRSTSAAILSELRTLTIDYPVAIAGLDELIAARWPEIDGSMPGKGAWGLECVEGGFHKLFIEGRVALAMEANILSEELMVSFWRLLLVVRSLSCTPLEVQAGQALMAQVRDLATLLRKALEEEMENRKLGYGWDWSALFGLIAADCTG